MKSTSRGTRMRHVGAVLVTLVSSVGLIAQQPSLESVYQSWKTIPPEWKAQSLTDVFKRLHQAPKGEFETTEEYRERTERRPGPTVYAFLFEDPMTGPYLNYDADKQAFDVGLAEDLGATVGTQVDKSLRVLRLTRVTSSKSYTASNLFGASTTIREVKEMRLGVILQNRSADTIGDVRTRHFWVACPRADAPAMKKSLDLILICQQHVGPEPLTVLGRQSGSDTSMTHPTSVDAVYGYIRVNIISLWVVDNRNGAVLLRVDNY